MTRLDLALRDDLATLPAEVRDARIMVLCDRAILELNEARTIEDVKRTADLASAFAAYTRKIKAAIEAQNATQTVVLLAEARIGAELKAAQERGEVATQNTGRPISVQGTDTSRATLTDLGIPRQRAAEMKRTAELGADGITVAALYVEKGGAYYNLDDVDPWDRDRDARLYAGLHPARRPGGRDQQAAA